MNNLNQPNVFASGKSENANSVICELGIMNETIHKNKLHTVIPCFRRFSITRFLDLIQKNLYNTVL